MKRRQFIRSIAGGTALAGLASPFPRLYAAPDEYTGRCLIVLQADGGWDVTSLCDPKMNVTGEMEINHWALSDETRVAGNIPYAPFASNDRLFQNHHQKMLVINGVDVQTNSHTTGVLHNWSGRNAAGYPSLSAMFAAHNAVDVPLSYVSFGGFSDTARLIRSSRLNDVETLLSVLQPNLKTGEALPLRRETEVSLVAAARRAALQRKLEDESLTPMQRYNAESYLGARLSSDSLHRFIDVLPSNPGDFQSDVHIHDFAGSSSLLRQIQLSVLAFEAGVCSSVDLLSAFHDSHKRHDEIHTSLFNHLADVVDYLWNYAEERGVADRITLLIGSDFSRTPHYNSDDGKDHWPIGSFIVMEQNPIWGNRVVGLTDEGHNAHKIDPVSLQRDDHNGTLIYPKHVHKALRRYLGLENTLVDTDFPFNNTEDFDLFNPSLRSN